MGSTGGDEVMISGSGEAQCSEATVEIKIKTLDSQTYTLRVDKCMPVPALKEQIASVTGVLSEQQRLICRGRVLKDDQLLSAYHVEDGHTLHLVVRQPFLPSSESLPDNSATDPASNTLRNQGFHVGSSVVVLSEQGDGVPDLSRIVSAVLSSFGVNNVRSGSEGADPRDPVPERGSGTPGLSGLRDSSSRQQPNQAATIDQSNPLNGASLLPNDVTLEQLQPPVIPDSLTTLSQYLRNMRHEFGGSVRGHGNNSAAGIHGCDLQNSEATLQSDVTQGGLPTPASLAEVILSTRQILIEQAAEDLSQLTRQLENHANVTDPSARRSIQSNALRLGAILQNLGALLLELGRTTMTLRMGQTPNDAVVNAGPAIFISTSGPNPIMVQPLPFHPGTSFGATPMGTVQPGSGFSSGTLRSGFLPRNIDIRIRTGSMMPPSVINQREPAGGQTSQGQTSPALSGGVNSIHQPAAGASRSSSSTREAEVRVVPIRTVVAAIPAAARRSPSDSSRSSMGLFYPVLARVQHVMSGNYNGARGSQASDEHQPRGLGAQQQSVPESASQQNIESQGRDGGENPNFQTASTQLRSGLDQLLRTIFPVEQIHVGSDVNFQGTGTSSTGITGTTEAAANTEEIEPRVGDEGTFLSNLLHHIMPLISQNSAMGSSDAAADRADVGSINGQDSTTHPQENSDVGTSSGRQRDPPSPPNSKRQKKE